MNRTAFSILKSVALILGAVLLYGCPPVAQSGTMLVNNDSATMLTGLYISHSTESAWGANQLASTLASGKDIEYSMEPGSWDVLAVDALDREWAFYGVLISANSTTQVDVSSMALEYDPAVESSDPQNVTGGTDLDVSLSDGTRIELPAVEASGDITQITLEQETDTMELTSPELETVGTVRKLTFDSFDPADLGVPAAHFTPQITIPAALTKDLDLNSISVFRVSDLFIDGEAYPAHESSLPVTYAENGDLVVTDFYFPDSIMSDLGYEAALKSGYKDSSAKATLHPREIRYVVGTFKGSYNWRIEPVLTHYYPESLDATGRVQYEGLNTERQKEEDAKIPTNIVILVHGHNEEEKLGGASSTAPSPWYYSYKRDVWTNLYQYISETTPDMAKCTAFYEYIYPTYWPIFTPQSGLERLDEDFAEKVNSLVALASQHVDVNVYIVAHSMGGLVARAGIQLFNNESHTAFQKLVTWGSPHMGSPLVSMRYVLGAGPGIYRAGPDGVVTFPLGNIDRTLFALRRAIDDMQVDAPGTRDLRWANSHTTTPRGLALDTLFSFDQDAAVNPALWSLYDLDNGTAIYNQNLNLLNANDVYRLSDKYTALFGVTTSRAEVTFPWSNWFRPTLSSTGPPLGALVMPWLVDGATDSYSGHVIGDSDGAVPIVSMAGAGVAGRQADVGDIDHEQYFGAPDKDGVFQAADEARDTAARTLTIFAIETCAPPGTKTFSVSGNSTVTDPTYAPYSLTMELSLSMDVTVNFDGPVQPRIEDDDTHENVKNIFVRGYTNPITISGSFNFSLSPMEYRLDSGTTYTIYAITKAQFEHRSPQFGNSLPGPTMLESGSGFTWTFTENPDSPWDFQPSFSPGQIVITYTMARYETSTKSLLYSEEKTQTLYGYAPPVPIHFFLSD